MFEEEIMIRLGFIFGAILLLSACGDCCGRRDYAFDTAEADVYLTSNYGHGRKIGVVKFNDTHQGVMVDVALNGLPKGEHGFHAHEYGDCGNIVNKDGKMLYAGRAGGHFDPHKIGKHLGPDKGGHLGDFPALIVSSYGEAYNRFFIPNVKASEFRNKAVVVHEGGDNYKDTPLPLGGGGARIACGVIE